MRIRIFLVGALVLFTVAACGSDQTRSGTTGTASGNSQATFVLTEFKINLEGSIPAGQVTIEVDNQGGEKHELVIVSAKDAASLPTKADGSVDEDKIPEQDKLGETGDIDARTSTEKTFTFAPGTYVAFCNIVDDMASGSNMMNGADNMPMGGGMSHVHFAQGMHVDFTVG